MFFHTFCICFDTKNEPDPLSQESLERINKLQRKDLSLNDEAGYIYIYKIKRFYWGFRQLYKVGRSNKPNRRIKEWSHRCGVKIELISIYPCSHMNRTEAIIHRHLRELGLANRISACKGCGTKHREIFKARLKTIRSVVEQWV